MSLYIFDTDHLSLLEQGHPHVLRNIIVHRADVISVSVISVEEQLEGWQRALRKVNQDVQREQIYRRMARTIESLAG